VDKGAAMDYEEWLEAVDRELNYELGVCLADICDAEQMGDMFCDRLSPDEVLERIMDKELELADSDFEL
jgi:hypothetical protein